MVSCLDGLFTYEQVEQTATAEAPVDIGSADLELDDLGGLDSLDDPADSLESAGELDDFGDLDDLDLSLDDEVWSQMPKVQIWMSWMRYRIWRHLPKMCYQKPMPRPLTPFRIKALVFPTVSMITTTIR